MARARGSLGPVVGGLLASLTVLVMNGCGPDTATSPTDDPPVATTTAAPATATQAKPSSSIVVPNGVGMDYQQAQDIWRAAGLHVFPAVDGLGAHRLPVIDSNWVVLSQDPPAGTEVERGSFITATVKKYTDD